MFSGLFFMFDSQRTTRMARAPTHLHLHLNLHIHIHTHTPNGAQRCAVLAGWCATQRAVCTKNKNRAACATHREPQIRSTRLCRDCKTCNLTTPTYSTTTTSLLQNPRTQCTVIGIVSTQDIRAKLLCIGSLRYRPSPKSRA